MRRTPGKVSSKARIPRSKAYHHYVFMTRPILSVVICPWVIELDDQIAYLDGSSKAKGRTGLTTTAFTSNLLLVSLVTQTERFCQVRLKMEQLT